MYQKQFPLNNCSIKSFARYSCYMFPVSASLTYRANQNHNWKDVKQNIRLFRVYCLPRSWIHKRGDRNIFASRRFILSINVIWPQKYARKSVWKNRKDRQSIYMFKYHFTEGYIAPSKLVTKYSKDRFWRITWMACDTMKIIFYC